MFGVLKTIFMCSAAGAVLALIFLTPTGIVVGSLNGFLVGICLCLTDRSAQREKPAPKPPVRLMGHG